MIILISPRALTLVAASIFLGTALAANDGMSGNPTADMQAVLDELQSLGAKPVETLTSERARQQPTPADAVVGVLKRQGKSTAPEQRQ